MAELDAATKRLDQSEGGKNALVDQVNMVKLLHCNNEYFESVKGLNPGVISKVG